MLAVLISLTIGLTVSHHPDDAAVDDEAAIQGRWDYVSVHYDGQPFHLEKGDHIMITGRNWSIHRNNVVIKSRHTLSPSKSPKQLDVVVERNGMTFRLKEIYRLEGDTLTLCEPDRPGAPRPSTFSANKGERQFLIVLKRSNAEDK